MQMNKEEVPDLILPGYHCKYLIATGLFQNVPLSYGSCISLLYFTDTYSRLLIQ